MTRGGRVESNMTFWSLLKTTKVRNLTWKYPVFYIAIIFAYAAYYLLKKMDNDSYKEIFPYVSDTIASISATLMGIIIAGLAIIVALAMGDVLNLLLKNKTLQKLLFPFWFVTLLWALSTLIAILLNFIPLLVSKNIEIYILTFEVFLFIYALFGTVGLIGGSIKIMIIIAQLVPKK
jgi:hypothetical protein